jgi:hypothetical protein
MVGPSLVPVKALASVAKGLPHQAKDVPPLSESIVRQGLSHVGRAWTETLSAPARSGESTIYSETRAAKVAQAPQVKGLPDLDHARYFLAVFEEVPAAIIKKAVINRIYYLVRPLF